MPDIRTTDILSDFGDISNNEDPISEGGSWERMVTNRAPNIIKNGDMTNQNTDTLGYSYWTRQTFDATPQTPIEAWGLATGGAGGVAGDGWRIAFAQTPGPGGGFHGYVGLDFHALSDVTIIRKYASETSFTSIGSGGSDGGGFFLFRYDGVTMEWWRSFDGDTWTLKASATDSSYTTNLYLAFGEEDQGLGQIDGWSYVGGGYVDDIPPQIYRRPNE